MAHGLGQTWRWALKPTFLSCFLKILNWVIFHNGFYSVPAYVNHNIKQRHPFGLFHLSTCDSVFLLA